MTPRTVRKAIIVASLTFALTGCFGQSQPIYNAVNYPIPAVSKPLTLADIQRNITLAGSERGWVFTPVEPGYLKGHLDQDLHVVDVDVRFSTTTFSISYVGSYNVGASTDGDINRSYNHWVHNLEADIEHQIVKASYQ